MSFSPSQIHPFPHHVRARFDWFADTDLLGPFSSSTPHKRTGPRLGSGRVQCQPRNASRWTSLTSLPILSYMFAVYGTFFACGLEKSDSLYAPLPAYHMSGGVIGMGMSLMFGIRVVVCRKFSASRFWTECIKHDCTVVAYSLHRSVTTSSATTTTTTTTTSSVDSMEGALSIRLLWFWSSPSSNVILLCRTSAGLLYLESRTSFSIGPCCVLS